MIISDFTHLSSIRNPNTKTDRLITVRLRYPMSRVLIRRRSDFYPILITVTGTGAGLVLIAGILCAEGFTLADRLRGIFGTVQDADLGDPCDE